MGLEYVDEIPVVGVADIGAGEVSDLDDDFHTSTRSVVLTVQRPQYGPAGVVLAGPSAGSMMP